MAPTSGGATVDSPGTNLATSSMRPRQRSKRSSDCFTQESGDSEMRHSVRITPAPKRRPARYHAVSLSRQAASAASTTPGSSSRSLAASAPATINVGTAGTGAPACSTSTLKNTTSNPYCAISAMSS